MDFLYKIKIGTGAFLTANYLTETGVSVQGFINIFFARYYRLVTVALIKPCNLKLINGELVEQIIYIAKVNFKIDIYYDELRYFITPLGFDLVLGIL